MNAIEYVEVSKMYKGAKAISNFSLEIPEGSFVVFMGASGSGKTTLLKMVNLLLAPDKGKVLFFGEDNRNIKLTQLRQEMGYVLQSAALFPHRTVSKNIATVPDILGWDKGKTDMRTRELLELMRMPYKDYANRYPSQLSGGQKQRVGIARALAAYPPVLLMDEPFAALDIIIRQKLQDDLIQIHNKDKPTILFVTHDIDEAFRLGDKVAILDDGKLVQYSTPADLLRNPANKYVEKMLTFLSVDAIETAVTGIKGERDD